MSTSCYLCVSGPKRPKKTKELKISLHKFPKDENVRKKWLSVCGLSEERDDVSTVKLCSLHFTDNDYLEPNAKIIGGRMCLKYHAVPSVSVPYLPIQFLVDGEEISHVASNSTAKEIRVPPAILDETANEQSSTIPIIDQGEKDSQEIPEVHATTSGDVEQSENLLDDIIATPKKRRFAEPRYVSEIRTPDIGTPKRARRVLSLVRRVDKLESQKIKALQDRNRYLLKRIHSLKDLVSHLRQKGLMSEEAANSLMVHFHADTPTHVHMKECYGYERKP